MSWKKTVIDKELSTETLLEEFKPVALERHEFDDRRNMEIKRTIFETTKFQSKGHNHRLFLPRNTQKYIIVKSDLDRRNQTCSFRKRRVGLTKHLYINNTSATFNQSGFQLQSRNQISWSWKLILCLK